MKNCLGECSLKVTRPDGECSKISVSNPVACSSTKASEIKLRDQMAVLEEKTSVLDKSLVVSLLFGFISLNALRTT